MRKGRPCPIWGRWKPIKGSSNFLMQAIHKCKAQLPPRVSRVDYIIVTWSVVWIEMIKLLILLVDRYHSPSSFCWWLLLVSGIEFFQNFLYLVVLMIVLSISLEGAFVDMDSSLSDISSTGSYQLKHYSK